MMVSSDKFIKLREYAKKFRSPVRRINDFNKYLRDKGLRKTNRKELKLVLSY